MKKLTRDQWRARKIFNSHEMVKAGGFKLYISYLKQETGRAYKSASYQVHHLERKTDPSGHWRNYGHMTFTIYGKAEKELRLQEAMAWAKEKYGIAEWERGFHGDYYPKGTMEAAMKATEPKEENA